MPTPKYKKFYQLMVDQHKNEFDQFKTIHQLYEQDPNNQEFHTVGRDIRDTIQFWERKLCSGMEKGANGLYSQKVAQKFWQLVEKEFPHIHQVGIIKK